MELAVLCLPASLSTRHRLYYMSARRFLRAMDSGPKPVIPGSLSNSSAPNGDSSTSGSASNSVS